MLIAPDGAAGSTTIEAVSALKLCPEDGMTMSSESPLCCRPSTRSTVRPSTDALRGDIGGGKSQQSNGEEA